MIEQPDVSALILKKLQETITSAELLLLEKWANSNPDNRTLLNTLLKEEQLMSDVRSFDNLWRGAVGVNRYEKMERAVLSQIPVSFRSLWKRWMPYAAIFVGVTICIGAWKFEKERNRDGNNVEIVDKRNTKAVENSAVLTLADGREINLSAKQGGIIIADDILYGDSSAVLDHSNTALWNSSKNDELKLTTPRGITYHITLADGTWVWLNAGSTLRYPSRFTEKERIVELEGEAYFDVAPKIVRNKDKHAENSKVPFIVKTNRQSVKVIGTQFNISAYKAEPETTTLVEGIVAIRRLDKVEFNNELILKPGDQSINSLSEISVKEVDVTSFIAWKDGLFHFKNTPFSEIIKQISRWYNVEVVYTNGIPKATFTGKMSRNLSLQSVLELLNVSNVHIHLESEKLIVD